MSLTASGGRLASGRPESGDPGSAGRTRRPGPWRWPAWGWSLLGVVAVWLLLVTSSSGSPWGALNQAVSLAPFLVLVSLGQMLVITLGPGNIDVSVGTVISLAAYVSVAVAAEAGPIAGLAAAVLAGLAAGVCSVGAILLLRIPPIVATLATSLIVASATLVLANGNTAGVDPALRTFVNAEVVGVPVPAVVVAAVTVAIALTLRHTTFGLGIIAVGQSALAAQKAGVARTRVVAVTFLVCGALAGVTGGLLAAYISPSTGLGTPYLLDSIAVAVVGGTLVAGGRPVPVGVWTGAIFFVLLSTLLNLAGWSVGAQNLVKGLLVVLVVTASSAATSAAGTSLRLPIPRFGTPQQKETTPTHG